MHRFRHQTSFTKGKSFTEHTDGPEIWTRFPPISFPEWFQPQPLHNLYDQLPSKMHHNWALPNWFGGEDREDLDTATVTFTSPVPGPVKTRYKKCQPRIFSTCGYWCCLQRVTLKNCAFRAFHMLQHTKASLLSVSWGNLESYGLDIELWTNVEPKRKYHACPG